MLELPAAPIMQPLKPEEQWVQLTLKEEWKEDWTYYVGNPSNWEMMIKNWTPLRRLESEIEGSNVFLILYGRPVSEGTKREEDERRTSEVERDQAAAVSDGTGG